MNLKKFIKHGSVCLLSFFAVSWTTMQTASDVGINYAPFTCGNGTTGAGVWVKSTNIDSVIQAALFDGSDWDTFATISATGMDVAPICGIDSAGNIVAAWEFIDGSNRHIMAATKAFDGSWDTPVTLSSSNHNTDVYLSMNSSGQVIVGWTDQINNSVQVATLNFGDSWSSITTIDSDTGYFGNLRLGIDSSGNGVLVFVDFNSGTIFESHTTGGFNSSWSEAAALTSSGLNTELSLKVAPSGSAIAAWTDVDTYDVIAAIYDSGTWGGATIVSDDFGGSPSVATSGTDHFISYINYSTGEVNGAITISGVWDSPFSLSPSVPVTGYQSSYGSGTFYTVWTETQFGEVFAVAYPIGGPLSSPVSISDQNLSLGLNISTSSTLGIAAWESIVDADHVIRANHN